jgi:hypothetical protein
MALRATQRPTQSDLGALSPAVERRGMKLTTHIHRMPDQKYVKPYLHSLHAFMAYAQHKDNFTLPQVLEKVINERYK